MGRTGAYRYWLIWAVVIPIAVWVPIRLFGLERGYPLVAMMAFTPYVALAALFVTGIAVALRNWAAAVIAATALACLAAVVLPRAVGSGTAQASGHETLTVLSANVHRGGADPRGLIELVDRFQPDLLSVQELTPTFARKLRRGGIYRRLPHASLLAGEGASGAGIYTSLPLRRLLAATRLPRVEIELPGGKRLRVFGVHPWAPLGTHVGIWRAVLADLPSAGSGVPLVLAGDFNATLDQVELRDVLDRGYRDAGEVVGKGLEPTWPADRKLPPLITIDHILADERLGIADYGVEDLSGSDHRAIHAQLVLP